MIRIGYFCTGGYTETGSIQGFLERINPNVRFIRCFPIANKTHLKKGRLSSTPIRSQNGITGDSLIREMRLKLHETTSKEYDLIILIDDMDCRFRRVGTPSYEAWVNEIKEEVNLMLGPQVGFEALFASPEIEGWFLADWNNTFANEPQYREIKDHLRYLISQSDINQFKDNIEDYGGAYLNGSCTTKISNVVGQIVQSEGTQTKQYYYSKSIQGVGMLARLLPENVAQHCRRYFAPVYRRLSVLR